MIARRVVRPPAVAGTFYPADRITLRAMLRDCFVAATQRHPDEPVPWGLVVPHAGFIHSGPVAASAYSRLRPIRSTIRRVVLLGPSHRVPFRGLALSGVDAWSTPLGSVDLATDATALTETLPQVSVNDFAHESEHSLEVQVPFLQTVLDDFELIPILVGAADEADVAAVIDAVWTDADTLLVVSTDLSHYHPSQDAVRLDARTAAAIVARRPDDILDVDACGARPLRGLLDVANKRDLTVRQVDVRNSGDTSGDRSSVVGYGAFIVA